VPQGVKVRVLSPAQKSSKQCFELFLFYTYFKLILNLTYNPPSL
jgi:hypothetical protein